VLAVFVDRESNDEVALEEEAVEENGGVRRGVAVEGRHTR
jgi:hypothetical protein